MAIFELGVFDAIETTWANEFTVTDGVKTPSAGYGHVFWAATCDSIGLAAPDDVATPSF